MTLAPPIRLGRPFLDRVKDGISDFTRTRKLAAVGAGVLWMFAVIAIFAPIIAPHPSLEIFPNNILSSPSATFPFGTDGNGMDVLSRTLDATRLDLMIASVAVALSAIFGMVLGLIAGYLGGLVDLLLLRLMDIVQAFPLVILALAFVAASGQSLANVIFIIAFVDTPVYLRLIRAKVLSAKSAGYVENARAIGNPTWRLLLRHVLPNTISPVVIETSTRLAYAIQITAALAFVGVGIQAPRAEWGAMMRQGSGNLLSGQWWISLFPGIAVVILVLGLNLFADGLQDFLDPRDDRG